MKIIFQHTKQIILIKILAKFKIFFSKKISNQIKNNLIMSTQQIMAACNKFLKVQKNSKIFIKKNNNKIPIDNVYLIILF